jgi:5-methylcytosine-specific restriction endonuclease McrA
MNSRGRLHLTAVVLLKRYLTSENNEALLAAAAGTTKAQVELLIAERFPKSDVPTSIQPIAPPPQAMASNETHPLASANSPAPPGQAPTAPAVENMQSKLVPEPVPHERTTPAPMVSPVPERRIAPLSPGRFELRLTMSLRMHDKLRYAQELLGHAVPSGDVPEILERALDELIAKQEKLKFAATERPRPARRSSNPRHIPARVKHAVWNRDQGRCTFVSDDGRRCEARNLLEYDHEQPVARGGPSSVANVRLRCRAHNQLEAERTFGAGFMEEKRRLATPPATSPARRALPGTRAASCGL